MNKDIFRKIAEKHGITAEEVKKEMEAAIDEAYKAPTSAALEVPRKGDIPTPDEFITHIAGKVSIELHPK